jgi:dTDP-4-dehydrorhamnose 3,5-epimerase
MAELFQPTGIEGCFTFKSGLFQDERGSFSKLYSQRMFQALKLDIPIAEVFFSNSHKGVLRGMHFQTPPHDQVKVVSCLQGRILDVILDLRKSSATFGKSIGLELTAKSETTVVIPRGCAHGFYAYEDNSLVCYMVETNHDKAADQGVAWDSFGFAWPEGEKVLSLRDRQFPGFSNFVNPF